MNYSNIFNLYKKNGISFYNILKKIQLPEDKTIDLYKKYIVPYKMPWIFVSELIYDDYTYYWLILLANFDKKLNPFYANAGEEIFIIKPEYLNLVISAINDSIN